MLWGAARARSSVARVALFSYVYASVSSPKAGAHAASIGRSTAHTGAPSHTAASERIKLEQGAVDTLESLLLAGADISVTDRHDRTLLHIVAGAYLLPATAMNTGAGVATSPDEPHARCVCTPPRAARSLSSTTPREATR